MAVILGDKCVSSVLIPT